MSAKMVKFHLMSKRGETGKFDQNPRSRGAATARTASFKFNYSAKRGYSEDFKFSRAIKQELVQTAHLKSTPKGRVPCAPKSRCNEAHCENTPPKHTQRTKKNPPKRCELRAIKILPQRRVENTAQFRYKDRCVEPKQYAQQAVNFINLAEQSLGYEFKFSRVMNRIAAQVRCARQSVAMNFKFNCAASYKFNQTARRMAAPKQRIWRFAEIPSQWHARRSMRQAAEISPRQYARQTARILQNRSLPRAAKILLPRYIRGVEIVRASAQTIKALLPRHMPQAEISRTESRKNSAAMRRAASRRNFIGAARMTSHQIPAESRKISNENREIPAERGAER
ncbi:hypothetical protein [uncultured Campylobacter sp.]|uniref:hypothetical protein n=1 Tax=uncultured Campylobacter sp. TaxID=218934 RepID=UPI00260E12BB|nr:hypothetical protein [uncultured Campylobacter sp.]